MKVAYLDGEWFITPETDFEEEFLKDNYEKKGRSDWIGHWYRDTEEYRGLVFKRKVPVVASV